MKELSHILLVIAILLGLHVSGLCQTLNEIATPPQCHLTMDQSPAIRGVKLGMRISQLMDVFPDLRQQVNLEEFLRFASSAPRYGAWSVELRPISEAGRARLAGIQQFSVQLLDENVTSMYVTYSGPYWDHVDQFIAKLAKEYALPEAKMWMPAAGSGRKGLKCNGFAIQVNAVGKNSCCSGIQIRDLSVDGIVKERERVDVEKQRQEFRP